jgi:hypothetical protein
VVKGLWKRRALDKMELALVPAGTCNDLARYYGLSKECWGRWEAVAPRPPGAFDLGPHGLEKFPQDSDRWGGRVHQQRRVWPPAPSFEKKDPPWRVLFSMNPIGVTARWDAGSWKADTIFRWRRWPRIFPGAFFLSRGFLRKRGFSDFYLVPARNKLRLAVATSSRTVGPVPLSTAKSLKLTTNRLTIDTDVPVWPQADGEPPPVKPARHMEFRVLPEKVKLWVVH